MSVDREAIEAEEPSAAIGREDFGVLARWFKVADIGDLPAYEARVRTDVPAISLRAHERLIAEAVREEREADDGFLNWALEAIGWHRGAFPDETMEQLGLCLAEEAGELVRTILKESHGANDRRAHIDWKAERAKEMGDVMIALVCIADRDGYDLLGLLWSRLNFIRERFPEAVSREQ